MKAVLQFIILFFLGLALPLLFLAALHEALALGEFWTWFRVAGNGALLIAYLIALLYPTDKETNEISTFICGFHVPDEDLEEEEDE